MDVVSRRKPSCKKREKTVFWLFLVNIERYASSMSQGLIKSTRHKVNINPTLTSNIIHASNNTIHQSYTLQTLMYTLFIHTHAYIKNPSSSMNAYTCSKKKATQSSWTESTTLSHCQYPRQWCQMLSPSPTCLPLRRKRWCGRVV